MYEAYGWNPPPQSAEGKRSLESAEFYSEMPPMSSDDIEFVMEDRLDDEYLDIEEI